MIRNCLTLIGLVAKFESRINGCRLKLRRLTQARAQTSNSIKRNAIKQTERSWGRYEWPSTAASIDCRLRNEPTGPPYWLWRPTTWEGMRKGPEMDSGLVR